MEKIDARTSKRYRFLADAVSGFHYFWIVLLLSGVILQLVFPWYGPINAVILAITIVSQIVWLGCPLVTLENAFRKKYDPYACFSGSFVCNRLKKWFGVEPRPWMIIATLAAISVLTIFFYLYKK